MDYQLPANANVDSLADKPTDIEELIEESRKGLPSWLISLIIHIIAILVLVLVPLGQEIAGGLSVFGSIGTDVGDAEFDLSDVNTDQAEVADALEEAKVKEMIEKPIDIPAVDLPTLNGPTLSAPKSISMGLSGRSGAMKGTLLRAFGGTKGTQDAVELGLAWLAKQQNNDGSWSLVGPYQGGGINENKAAATAMAMIAFLGAGNTHQSGQYKSNVSKGMYYLLQIQQKNGFFAKNAGDHQQAYTQAQCMIALCELYGMTKDKALEDAVEKSVLYAYYAQSPSFGWRYQPRSSDSDLSITGWYVMGLMSARMADKQIDMVQLGNVHKFLDSVQHEGGAKYGYVPYNQESRAMTAEGMLCRQYLGWKQYDPRLQDGAEYLLESTINPKEARNYYYWYYATQTLHHMGGDFWERWNNDMKVNLPAMQEKNGKEAGSWSPAGEPWGTSGGRLYATCFSIYCLEVYYRHMPIYGLN